MTTNAALHSQTVDRSRFLGHGDGLASLVHRFISSVTYSHAASGREGWAGVGERARSRLRSWRLNFHWKGEAIC